MVDFLLKLTLYYQISLVNKKIDVFLIKMIFGGMSKVLSIKIDPRMKQAIEKLAEKEFSPVTTIVKKALDKYLQDHGIDWRKEKIKKRA